MAIEQGKAIYSSFRMNKNAIFKSTLSKYLSQELFIVAYSYSSSYGIFSRNTKP